MACVHHWKIASPDGPTSHGTCRRCGAERKFPNYDPDTLWGPEEDRAGRAERIRAVKARASASTGVSQVVG
jgi:hypothetical protein